MKLVDLVSALAEQLGTGPLEANAEGEYSLYIDDLQIDLLADADGVNWMRGEVAPVPEEDTEAWLKNILTIGFGRVRRQEATVSLDPEGRRVWLHLRLPEAYVSPDQLAGKLETFVNVLETWRGLAAAGAASSLPRGPMPFMMR